MHLLKSLRTLRFDKQSVKRMSVAFKHKISRLPEQVIIVRSRAVEAVILGSFLVVSGWIVASFLFLSAAPVQEVGRRTELLVGMIDDLELWLEEENNAFENPPVFPESALP